MAEAKKINGLTVEQVEKLTNQGLSMELIETFKTKDLISMIENNPSQSYVPRTKKRQQNIAILLDGIFVALLAEGENSVQLTREEVAEQIRLLNQTSFFEVRGEDGQPFLLPNSRDRLGYFYNPSYKFIPVLDNKQTEAATTDKDKAKICLMLWSKRGGAIVSEIGNKDHSKYYNNKDNENKLTMSEVKRGTTEITFTLK